MSLFYILCEIYINNRYTVGVLGRKKRTTRFGLFFALN